MDQTRSAPNRSIIDIVWIVDTDPAVERLTSSIENFNSLFIRLPATDQWSFSALSVLHTLSRVGPCRLSELVSTEQIKQPALTTAVAKLERHGLIARIPDPSDGRASLLSLTADGRAIVSRRHADRAERLGCLIDRLSSADRSRLLSVAGVFDQIVQFANQQAQNPRRGSQNEHESELPDADAGCH
jgi:DNA-binding MarR family transcriptional regulator